MSIVPIFLLSGGIKYEGSGYTKMYPEPDDVFIR